MSKLIILRGNSASGKSSVAHELQIQLGYGTALIEQDYIRRKLLRERDRPNQPNIELIALNVLYSLEHCDVVILEGILSNDHYSHMLAGLLSKHPDHYVYYFDISLEETLRRHATKPVANEYGEEQMRKWYLPYDVLRVKNEQIIDETLTLEQIVEKIKKDVA
jgi:predicted kinase